MLLSFSTWVSSLMNTSVGTNMLKQLCFKAGRQVGLLGRVCRYITTHSANAIFLCTVRPTLEYCAGVCGCCGEVNSGILETLRKCVGRIVIETPSSDTAVQVLGPDAMSTS